VQVTESTAQPLIDAFVHHTWATQSDVMAYMSRRWEAYLRQPETINGAPEAIPILPMIPFHHPDGDKLPDTAPAGGPAGSSYPLLKEQLLDRLSCRRAVLAHDVGIYTPALPNPELAAEVVRAVNRWTIEQWAAKDERLYALLLVPTQTVEDAAAEIARYADESKIVGVLLAANGLNRPFGHPAYDKIFAAAAAHDLPVVIQLGADALSESLTHPTAGGLPTMYAEFAMLKPQAAMTHLISLICQGAFDRNPDLRVMFAGAGAAWLPSVMWRCDTEYSAYRRETPSLRSKPGDYVRDRVRVCTSPFDVAPRPAQLVKFMEAYGSFDDLLVYGSGYPNWDTDWPDAIHDRVPEEWRSKVFYDNALEFFRWDRSTGGTAERTMSEVAS
jgi:uncharacterized protein